MTAVENAVREVRRASRERAREEKAKMNDPVLKKLPAGFAEEAERMSVQELRDSIVQAETLIKRVLEEMEADEKLQGARAIVKDLTGPYNDARKAQAAKIQYVLRLLDEKGELSDEAPGAEE